MCEEEENVNVGQVFSSYTSTEIWGMSGFLIKFWHSVQQIVQSIFIYQSASMIEMQIMLEGFPLKRLKDFIFYNSMVPSVITEI